MLKNIIYTSIAIAVVVAGYIGAEKLNYWPRSVRIFNYNSVQAFSGRMDRNHGGFEGRMEARPGEDSQRSRIRHLPDDSAQPGQRNNRRIENFEGRSRHEEYEGLGRGVGRGRSAGNNRINLRNVWWFLAVFSAFTVVTIYSDKIVRYAVKKSRRE